jgi:CelD/BcsL family acetyltransferase involved in cellulose biosynthesis
VIVRQDAEASVVACLAHELVRRGAVLDMRQLRITRGSGTVLARALGRAGCQLRASRTHRCPVIDLRGGCFEAYLANLGSEHRYNFRRRLRRLSASHDLRFECAASEERRRALLPVLFELHRLRWAEAGGSDGLAGAGIFEFHEELTRLALEQGWLRLFVLWLGDAPAAALYGFRYGPVFSFYQSGFDPRYRKLGVGRVAMGLAIERAFAEGADEFDMLHGEEAYKFDWARRTRRLGRIVAFPGGPLGRLAWGAAAARDAARSLVQRFPSGLAAGVCAAWRGGNDAASAG